MIINICHKRLVTMAWQLLPSGCYK